MPGNIKHTVGSGMGGFRGDLLTLSQAERYTRAVTKGKVGLSALTKIPLWEDRNTDNIGSKLNG